MNSKKIVQALEQVIEAVKEQTNNPVENKRFKILSDGWIRDKALGKDWGPSSDKRMNFAEAGKYVEEKGGILPTVKELRSLIDYDRKNPAIDTDFFGDTKTDDWYWTGTMVAGSSSFVWCVDFFGNVCDCNEDYGYYVRPVRPSQCLII